MARSQRSLSLGESGESGWGRGGVDAEDERTCDIRRRRDGWRRVCASSRRLWGPLERGQGRGERCLGRTWVWMEGEKRERLGVGREGRRRRGSGLAPPIAQLWHSQPTHPSHRLPPRPIVQRHPVPAPVCPSRSIYPTQRRPSRAPARRQATRAALESSPRSASPRPPPPPPSPATAPAPVIQASYRPGSSSGPSGVPARPRGHRHPRPAPPAEAASTNPAAAPTYQAPVRTVCPRPRRQPSSFNQSSTVAADGSPLAPGSLPPDPSLFDHFFARVVRALCTSSTPSSSAPGPLYTASLAVLPLNPVGITRTLGPSGLSEAPVLLIFSAARPRLAPLVFFSLVHHHSLRPPGSR